MSPGRYEIMWSADVPLPGVLCVPFLIVLGVPFVLHALLWALVNRHAAQSSVFLTCFKAEGPITVAKTVFPFLFYLTVRPEGYDVS
eukprot:12571641-Ditylum_brightwellii.AAC.1